MGAGLCRLAFASVVFFDQLVPKQVGASENENALSFMVRNSIHRIHALPFSKNSNSVSLPPPAVAVAALEEYVYVRAALQHSALRTIRRLVHEELLPE